MNELKQPLGRLIDRVSYKIPSIAGLIGDALSMFLGSSNNFDSLEALLQYLDIDIAP
jgi:hypothetical protein